MLAQCRQLDDKTIQTPQSNRSAFTLIELSIVLVVIGLIVGGTLAGQSLVFSANVRKQISQITTLETQLATFKGKFDCLPGDCANATTFLGTTFGSYSIANGDGDGFIRANNGGSVAPECLQDNSGGELSQLFVQLNAAKLGSYSFLPTPLSGGYAIYEPETALANGTAVFVSCTTTLLGWIYPPSFLGTGNDIIIGGEAGTNSARVGYATGIYSWNYNNGIMGIQQIYAQAIDQKIDDGLPNSGLFGVVSSSPNNSASCSTGSNAYPLNTGNCLVTTGKVIKAF